MIILWLTLIQIEIIRAYVIVVFDFPLESRRARVTKSYTDQGGISCAARAVSSVGHS